MMDDEKDTKANAAEDKEEKAMALMRKRTAQIAAEMKKQEYGDMNIEHSTIPTEDEKWDGERTHLVTNWERILWTVIDKESYR